MSETDINTPQDPSRRDFLIRSTLATGAVWASPSILRVGSTAFAQTQGSPPIVSCSEATGGVLAIFRWEAGDIGFDASLEEKQCPPDDYDKDYPVVEVEVLTAFDEDGDETDSDDAISIQFSIPDGCVLVDARAKSGSGEEQCDSSYEVADDGLSFTIMSLNGRGVSHVAATLCCAPA